MAPSKRTVQFWTNYSSA